MLNQSYQEQQSFRYTWGYWLCFAICSLLVFGCWQQFITQQPFGNKPAPDLLLLLLSLLMLSLLATLHFSSLQLHLNHETLKVRFLPFFRTWRIHKWQDIQSVNVVVYSPIADFGGWGIRGNKSHRCYNVIGNQGLRVKFKTGHTLLIGTQQAAKLNSWLAQHQLNLTENTQNIG